ncbi:hypothetical protein Ciccas_000551 [Cichlidogyrus casuarinus]|uniref:Cytochrome b561 domain-containing protein n=1 Tax=Cichlidogyrus casuarinus TaxID=1844966 RepID=A0ABD2QMJ2_9PLAT
MFNIAMYDSLEYDQAKEQNLAGFMPLFCFAQAVGIMMIILTGYWMSQWGGFNWDNGGIVFNYHPFFMILSLVFFYGDAILLYRVCRRYRKWPVKVAHAIVNFSALIFAIIGVTAAFTSHNLNKIPNLYSLHSWIGLLTFLLFISQWVLSFLTFLYPGGSDAMRARMMPVHKYLGLFLFFCSLVSAISGITEKNFFSKDPAYSLLQPREMAGNFIGMLVMLFGGLVFYLVHNDEYKRIEGSPSQEPIVGSR